MMAEKKGSASDHSKRFELVNFGRYKMPKGQVSGTCQQGKHGKCFSTSCDCPCHK